MGGDDGWFVRAEVILKKVSRSFMGSWIGLMVSCEEVRLGEKAIKVWNGGEN